MCLYITAADREMPRPRRKPRRRITMSKVKKVIALVLVVALCVSLLSSLAFAEGPDFEPTVVDNSKTPYKVLFFSDQSLLGRNMVGEANADKYQSYANEFVQYVQDRVGNNYAVEGIFANKGYAGMRNSDLFAAIRPDGNLWTKVLDNPVPTTDTYYKNMFKSMNEDAMKELRAEMLGFVEKDGTMSADPNVKAIVLDLTHNDLSAYLLARLMDIVKDYADYVNIDYPKACDAAEEGKEPEFKYVYDGAYAEDTVEGVLPKQLTSDTSLILSWALGIAGSVLTNLTNTDIGDAVRKTIEYTITNFCLGFTETALALKYWYPNARLMVVGATNELDGVKVTLPKAAKVAETQDAEPEPAKPETTTIDLGLIYGSIADIANLYITSFSDKYGINSTYYYADVADSVEPIYKALGNLGGEDNAVREKFVAKVNEDFTALAMKYLTGKTVGDVKGEGYQESDKTTLISKLEKTAINFIVSNSSLANNVIVATKYFNNFDLSGIDKDKFGDIVGNAIFNGMTKSTEEFLKNPADVAILGLYGLVAGNGYALYPTADSQYSKLQAVKEAFVALRTANNDSGSSIGNVVIDGIVGVLTVFSSDILQALSSIFNPDTGIFAKFFNGIRGFFENLFDDGGLFNRVDTETT